MTDPSTAARFRLVAEPHLDAAYNLARWLMPSAADADDVVQDAYLRALRFFDGFRGGDGRAWLLTIVRHVCFDRLARDRQEPSRREYDEARDGLDEMEVDENAAHGVDPQTLLLRDADRARIESALRAIPSDYREVIVLREIEGMSYKEIAAIASVPIGTVMSRLARARQRLRVALERNGESAL